MTAALMRPIVTMFLMFCILSFPFLFLLFSMLLLTLPPLLFTRRNDRPVDQATQCNAAEKGREVGTGG
jgi:hypothetical protein